MKNLSLIICFLILFVTAAKAQTPDASKAVSWQQYTVAGESFSVSFPLLPALHFNSRYREVWDKERKIIQLGAYADGVAYTVFAIENPSPKVSLEEFIAEQTSGRTPEAERNISRNGFSGKVLTATDPNDGMAQFFATDDHLYSFHAFGAPAEDERLTKFFSSVSFAKVKDAVKVAEGPGEPYKARGTDDEAADQIFTGKEVTRKIRLAMKPEPSYTEEARNNGITGTVILKCIFASDGSVKNIKITAGLPYGLTERAIQAATKIKFIPGIKDGKYVSMWMQLEYNFNLY